MAAMIGSWLFILTSILFAGPNTESPWTNTSTEKVTVIGFNKNCVQIKRKSGEKLSLKREGFHGIKMVSGSTEVEIHPETVKNSLCTN
jgi:hypothetical protein